MDAIELLAAGDKSILNAAPVPLSCRPLSRNSDIDFLEDIRNNTLVDLNTNIIG